MTRKQNKGPGNDGRNGGGGPRKKNTGGHQIKRRQNNNNQNWDQWNQSVGNGNNDQNWDQWNQPVGKGGGCGRTFTKFADVDKRSRGHKVWIHENDRRSGRSWVHNNHYNNNDVNTREFGGTSNLYDNTEEINQNNNDFSETQSEWYDGTVAGNNQQVSYVNMENKTQNPHQPEVAPMQKLNNEIQNTNTIKSSLPNDDGTNAARLEQEIPAVQTPKLLINIKKEKHEIKVKSERIPSSSSSLSYSATSSRKDPEKLTNVPPPIGTTANVNPVASPLVIKIKPSTASASNSTNTTSTSTSLNITLPKKPPTGTTSSSSSTSSSETEEEQHPPPPTTPPKKEKTRKNKEVGDGDVVCLGVLENKIVLEDDDEDDSSDKNFKSTKSQRKGKKSDKKSVDKCMICDKKGHTSFQCQMICKNCSAPYHGFRTCPHPANLNTMLQTFLEFSMQQLQNFHPDKQFTHWSTNQATASRESADSQLSGAVHKAKKRKSHLKAKDTGRNLAMTKKRKVSTKKKQPNGDEDDSDSTPSEESSSVSEDDNSSDGSESLNTSINKKSKAKSKSYTTMPGFNIPSFMPNTPINYPLGLNGIGNLTASSGNPQLNSLLLTQMFQNAIGSLSNQKRS